MQKIRTATVNTASAATPRAGSDKDMKDVSILGGLVFFLAIVIAAFWYYSQADEAAHSNRLPEALNSTEISQVFKSPPDNVRVVEPVPTTAMVAASTAIGSTGILHDDIQFEIGRKGLSDDGKAALGRHAEFLTREPDWGVLLTGYTDHQGSKSFNKVLGLKRAETVKQQLMALGVPETSIRTVSLGEEGALCLDNSDVCRRMNRRVHLEMRKIGQDHLVIPTVAVESAAPVVSSVDSTQSEKTGTLPESPLQGNSEPADTLLEPAIGH